jgi:hypothetical protein
MERFCGSLVRAAKSKKHPYTSIAYRLLDIAQLNQVKIIYNLSSALNLSEQKDAETKGTRFANCEIFELVYTLDSEPLHQILSSSCSRQIISSQFPYPCARRLPRISKQHMDFR